MPTPMEEYLFDLHGYTVIKGALDLDHLRAMNDFLDALPSLQIDQWYGNIDVHTYSGIDGMNLQNIIEGGEFFERLIDYPAWIDLVRHYIGSHDRPFINEGFINIRGPGGYIGVHSGGHMPDSRNRTGRSQGEWCCCLLTLMVPLTDVGLGDGPTVIVPGSHKSDFPHPMQKASAGITHSPGETIEGTMEVYLKAGDALLFKRLFVPRFRGAKESRRAAHDYLSLSALNVCTPLCLCPFRGIAVATYTGAASNCPTDHTSQTTHKMNR